MQGRQTFRARSFARLSLTGGALCMLAAIFAPLLTAEAAPGGTLFMYPANNALEIGDTVAVTIDVGAGIDINAVHVALTYNAAVLQVVDADAGASGTQILPGPFPGDDTVGTVLQNTVASGIINYQYELLGANQVSGAGAIATVQFEAVAAGNGNLSWTTRQFTDINGATSIPSASAAVIVVGNVAQPDTATPTASTTAASTNTATPTATSTGTVAASATSNASSTPTRTATVTRTPAPSVTVVAAATATPRITVLENSNAPPASRVEPSNGVDPSQTDRANGLPSAGNDGPEIIWWRWTFFAAALMLGIAGWFFTFAVHYGEREVVLMDRFDAKRLRNGKRKLPKR